VENVAPGVADLPTGSSCDAFVLNAQSVPICNQIRGAIDSGRLDDARRLASELLRLEANRGVGDFWLAHVELKEAKYFSAVRRFENAVDRNPDAPIVHLHLGLTYLIIQQYKLFRDEMQFIIRSRPEQALPYYYLGRFYSKDLDDPDFRISFFQKALERDRNHYPSRYHLGYLFELKGDLERAKSEYEYAAAAAESQNVLYALPWQGLARVYLRQDLLSDALRCATRAAVMNPKLAGSRQVLGKAYLQIGEAAKAVGELRAAAELDPKDASTQYLLFKAYSKTGNSTEAQQAQQMFLRLRAAYGSE
jgi:predicted Zn-dependent protease